MRSSTCNKWLGRLASLLVAFVISSTLVFAQTKTVTGTIVDDLGEPMIGVNVVVVGTTNGATTDIDGNFSITNVADNATIKVTFVGYKEINLPVAGKNTFNITLEEDRDELEEVVVIGYGTVKRKDLTGAVASVTGDKLKANPVSNVAQALQGMLPGVSVTAQDGRPGASMSIRVRGGGSITQSNDPLFIVDGVQVSSIDDIPADNIESMDVLKDAASTAIYGARGANGVILITTKGAKEGKAVVKYGVYYQTKVVPEIIAVQNAQDMVYNTWAYSAAYNNFRSADDYANAKDMQGIERYYGLGSRNGNHYAEYAGMDAHNYVDDLMRTAGTWNHDVSVSGGTEKTKIYAALNYTNDEGIRINSGYKRAGANFKIDQKINKKLSVDFDLRYVETTVIGDHYQYATSAFSYRPIDNPLGTGALTDVGNGDSNVNEKYNPYLLTRDNYDYDGNNYRIRARGGVSYDILKGLKLRSELSMNRNWTENRTWDAGMINGISSAKLDKKNGYGVRWATTLNYEIPGLGKDNSLSVLLGNEVLGSKSNSSSFKGQGYPGGFTMSQAFGQITMTDKVNDTYSNTIGTPTHTLSWFGRVNYSYKGRYLLTGTFRADGSSKFAPNNHWGYFPAAAAAWRISDEDWMESTRDWLDNLKLRLSFGTSGSDNIDASLWKETWTTKDIIVDGETVSIYQPGSMKPNPDLMWETTTSRNLGIDYAVFNSRVRGSLELYWNSTDDILMRVPTDASSGYEYQYQNVGKTSNKGVELSLSYDIVRSKDFNLMVNLNYNFNTNKIEELVEGVNCNTRTGWASSMISPSYDYRVTKGDAVGTIYAYKYLGRFEVDDFNYDAATGKYNLKPEIKNVATVQNANTATMLQNIAGAGLMAPGMPKFEDADGDGLADEVNLGSAIASHTGGFTFSGNYKSIDFSMGFTYQIGGLVYNADAMAAFKGDKDTSYGRNRLAYAADAYRYYDVNAQGDLEFVGNDPDRLRALNKNTSDQTIFNEYGVVSSQYVEDASYLRLNTLTVGYSLPNTLLKKVGLTNVRVYATGGNLFCLTGYSGLDPEVNTSSSNGGFPTPNYDYQSYPKARTLTIGANITF